MVSGTGNRLLAKSLVFLELNPRGTTADRSGVEWERMVCALCSDGPGFGNGVASDMKMKHSTRGPVAIIAVGTLRRHSIAPR